MDGLAAGPDGYADLLGDADPAGRGPGQRLMGTRLLPEIYERLWRPVLGVLGPGAGAERRLVRELLELGPGDRVLDAGCGPETSRATSRPPWATRSTPSPASPRCT